MDLNKIHTAYFLGIGGIGMSAIARYFLDIGISVHGYDKTPSKITSLLIEEGAVVHYDDNPEIIPKNTDIAIYTPAIPKDLNEFVFLNNSKIPLYKRAEILGMIANEKKTIAVAGTHGKTTVCAILAHILKSSGVNFSAFLGGIASNYNSNFISNSDADWILVEADEFDRSFLHLKPDIAVITAMDADHLDVYNNKSKMIESFSDFIKQIKPGGTLIINKELQIPKGHNISNLLTYHDEIKSDFYCDNTAFRNNTYISDFKGVIEEESVIIGLPGKHNLKNTLAATAAAYSIGVKPMNIFNALRTFTGIKRRFEVVYKNHNVVYIDDYAHHPEEIKACVNAVKEIYPGKKILGVFQPHLYSRTRDFADGFADSLSLLDELILLDIYPAREQPIKGVSSEIIFKNVKTEKKILIEKEQIVKELEQKCKNYDVILTMGAGNIDRYTELIKSMLERNFKNKT